MTLKTKQWIIGLLGGLFLLTLLFVQAMEVARRQAETSTRRGARHHSRSLAGLHRVP